MVSIPMQKKKKTQTKTFFFPILHIFPFSYLGADELTARCCSGKLGAENSSAVGRSTGCKHGRDAAGLELVTVLRLAGHG